MINLSSCKTRRICQPAPSSTPSSSSRRISLKSQTSYSQNKVVSNLGGASRHSVGLACPPSNTHLHHPHPPSIDDRDRSVAMTTQIVDQNQSRLRHDGSSSSSFGGGGSGRHGFRTSSYLMLPTQQTSNSNPTTSPWDNNNNDSSSYNDQGSEKERERHDWSNDVPMSQLTTESSMYGGPSSVVSHGNHKDAYHLHHRRQHYRRHLNGAVTYSKNDRRQHDDDDDGDDAQEDVSNHVLDEIPLGQRSLSATSSSSVRSGTGNGTSTTKYSTKGITGGRRQMFITSTAKKETDENRHHDPSLDRRVQHYHNDRQVNETCSISTSPSFFASSEKKKRARFSADTRDNERRMTPHISGPVSGSQSSSTLTSLSSTSRGSMSVSAAGTGTGSEGRGRYSAGSRSFSTPLSGTSIGGDRCNSYSNRNGTVNSSVHSTRSQIEFVNTGNRRVVGRPQSQSKTLLGQMRQSLRSTRSLTGSSINSSTGSAMCDNTYDIDPPQHHYNWSPLHTEATLRYPPLSASPKRQQQELHDPGESAGQPTDESPGQKGTSDNEPNDSRVDHRHNDCLDGRTVGSPTHKTNRTQTVVAVAADPCNDNPKKDDGDVSLSVGPNITDNCKLKIDFLKDIDAILMKKKDEFEKSIKSDVGLKQKCEDIVEMRLSQFKTDLDNTVADIKADCTSNINRSVSEIHDSAISKLQSSIKSTVQSSFSTMETKKIEIANLLDAQCTQHLDDMEQQFRTHESSLKSTASNLISIIKKVSSNLMDGVAENIHAFPRTLKRLVGSCRQNGKETLSRTLDGTDRNSTSDSASTANLVSSRSTSASSKRSCRAAEIASKSTELSTSPMISSSPTKSRAGVAFSKDSASSKKRNSGHLRDEVNSSLLPSIHKRQRIHHSSSLRVFMGETQPPRASGTRALSTSNGESHENSPRNVKETATSSTSTNTSGSRFQSNTFVASSQETKKSTTRKRESIQSRTASTSLKDGKKCQGRRRRKVAKDPMVVIDQTVESIEKTRISIPRLLLVDMNNKHHIAMSPLEMSQSQERNGWAKTKRPNGASAARQKDRRGKKAAIQSSRKKCFEVADDGSFGR